MSDKKKLLVTGSCGFVFGNFLRQAVYSKQPYHLISLDRVSNNTINSMYWNKNHVFHIADVTDRHIIDTIFQLEKPEIVIHGAESNNSSSEEHIHANILGTQNIIEICNKHNIQKLIYISNNKVYGQLSSESEESWLETSQLNPRSVYAITKVTSELLVKNSNIKYNIIRSSNNYGPRQSINKLIPKIIKCILDERPIPIYDQGLQVRDWVHVYDNCSAIFTVLQNGKDNEIYNVSSNQEFSNIEMAMHVCNIMGKGHNLISYVPNLNNYSDFRRATNATKLKSLGWKPNIKFKEGITETIYWYLNNRWYLK